MKNKSSLLLSVILIAFMVVTSYAPNAVQAEMPKQEEPVSGTQSDKGQVSSAGDSDALSDVNTPNVFKNKAMKTEGKYFRVDGYFNAVGINFVPHDSDLTYYNGGFGCLGSNYAGAIPKTFSIPLNIPSVEDGRAEAQEIHFTYYNNVPSPGTGIHVTLFKRKVSDLTTEIEDEWDLDEDGHGLKYKYFDLFGGMEFFSDDSIYWLEILLPDGVANREFCGVQLFTSSYFWLELPPLFPLAFPGVTTKP